MSATMRQGLADLLTRKTAEARARLRSAIEGWNRAVGAAKQAEAMVSCVTLKALCAAEPAEIQRAALEFKRARSFLMLAEMTRRLQPARADFIGRAVKAMYDEVQTRQAEFARLQEAATSETTRLQGELAKIQKQIDQVHNAQNTLLLTAVTGPILSYCTCACPMSLWETFREHPLGRLTIIVTCASLAVLSFVLAFVFFHLRNTRRRRAFTEQLKSKTDEMTKHVQQSTAELAERAKHVESARTARQWLQVNA